MNNIPWNEMISAIGDSKVNKELDEKTRAIYKSLQELSSLCLRDNNLLEKISSERDAWLPARDQYERSILHLAAMDGNTKLVKCLVYCGALINERDGIGQTPLTLAMHMSQTVTAKWLIENGASVNDDDFATTESPASIAKTMDNTLLEEIIKQKTNEIDALRLHLNQFLQVHQKSEFEIKKNDTYENFARALNINVGDQKNTVNIQGCSIRCPDIYSCHTPGGGDFHNRGYINESIARIAGRGGFWHVAEQVMKRPTVNPSSFKQKFKNNNYNNNDEALVDYDDGLSIAMMKSFHESEFFPSDRELEDCLITNQSHNRILLQKFSEWLATMCEDKQFAYQSQIVNDLMPITRWYKESIRHGNGLAIEGVWMLCPQLYAPLGKINYRDESFTMVVNTIAKWPLAYRKMYQQNRCVNVNGKKGRQIAGDEWVECHLVRPIKQYASGQTSFPMLEMMSYNVSLLESTREMYKSKEAFDIHNTKRHCTPGSMYDQLRVARFALQEEWFVNKQRKDAKMYPWAGHPCKEGDIVPNRYLNILKSGDEKAKEEFTSFLYRKFAHDIE